MPRARRTPGQMLADLEAERDAFLARAEQKALDYDRRIEGLKQKHGDRIAVHQLAQKPSTELAQQLDDAKAQQRLLRRALAKAGAR